MSTRAAVFAVALSAATLVGFACGSSSSRDQFGDDSSSGSSGASSGASGFGGDGSSGSSGGPDSTADPVTCDDAKTTRSYVGCDYWPTVTGNSVWSIFDYAVVVSNIGMMPATVTVTGNGTNQTVTVAPGSLEKIYLPWQPALKGPDQNSGGQPQAMTASVVAKGGAYHLVSSVPVVVYQFSALEYKPQGGPPGKQWNKCPAQGLPCFSYSNDASLLLPSTAWTQSYRVAGIEGLTLNGGILGNNDVMGGYLVVTAAQDGTNVTVTLSNSGTITAGGGIAATNGGGKVTQTLNAGDAIELVTPQGSSYDLSGSLVTADKPIEVFTGIQCTYVPSTAIACDHVEEAVVPAEALGKQYVVTTPTRPAGGAGLHVVKFVGNRDGTTLTYTPSKPTGCPDALSAGQIVECNGPVDKDFVVSGSQEFAVTSFMVGASLYDMSLMDSRGDPSQTSFASTEQYRTKYLFLAPDDYDVSYAVVTGPPGADPQVDGKPLSGATSIDSNFSVWRVTLTGNGGSHTLTSTAGVGLQVMGYGANTSYQYPGGLNLKTIAPPPPIK